MKRARVESSLITDIKSVGNLEEKGPPGFCTEHYYLLFIFITTTLLVLLK
jgi:hypothetical protein